MGEKGWKIPQDQCMFLGSNRHNDCTGAGGGGGGRNPKCSGPIAKMTKCGEASEAETWDDCNGRGNAGAGDELYMWMVGKPRNHPEFTGELTMISHKKHLPPK